MAPRASGGHERQLQFASVPFFSQSMKVHEAADTRAERNSGMGEALRDALRRLRDDYNDRAREECLAIEAGDTLVTSIDARVQAVVEQQLESTIKTARQRPATCP